MKMRGRLATFNCREPSKLYQNLILRDKYKKHNIYNTRRGERGRKTEKGREMKIDTKREKERERKTEKGIEREMVRKKTREGEKERKMRKEGGSGEREE